MVRRVSARAFLVAGMLSAAVAVVSAQWPEFRGPTGQGHSSAVGLPLSWNESENVVWKSPVPGRGWSSPAVVGNQVWLTTAVETRDGASLRAMAFAVDTGAEIVDVEVFKSRQRASPNPKNSLASPTPIVAGDRVYVHFGQDGTAALTTSGEIVWKARFSYESQHGSGGTPVLYNDLLIFNCDGSDQAFVVALDVATGKVRWRTARRMPYDQAYATPLVVRVGERDQLISPGAYRAVAYDPLTGREIWRADYSPGFSNVPRPVAGHGLVFIATGFQQPFLMAVRLDGTGDVTRSHVVWKTSRGAPLTPSPLLVGDELYFVSDIGVASAVDARTGTFIWQQRLGGNYSASPVFADGRIYFSSEDGVTTAIAPGREFKRLSTSQIDGAMMASLAVAEGSFFLRSHSHLYRIGTSANR
jgi:outer membrane protein assembly factor BamB